MLGLLAVASVGSTFTCADNNELLATTLPGIQCHMSAVIAVCGVNAGISGMCPVTCAGTAHSCTAGAALTPAQCFDDDAWATLTIGMTCAAAVANPTAVVGSTYVTSNWNFIHACKASSGLCNPITPSWCLGADNNFASDPYVSGCAYYASLLNAAPLTSCAMTLPPVDSIPCDPGDTLDASGPYYYSPNFMHTVRMACPVTAGCTAAHAHKDPHFALPHGGRADIRGEHGAIYNLLSAKNVSFAAKFEEADFKWSKRTVHGTKMAAAYWTIRTQTGKLVTVEFAPAAMGQPQTALVTVDVNTVHKLTTIDKDAEHKPDITVGNLRVSLDRRKVTVATERWSMAASANTFPFASLNKGKVLLDIEVNPLYDADKDVVAPHGIFGQAYDGDDLAVDGAIDKAESEEMTTKAQGEGAIEGVISDYRVATPFETAFKYSRFDAVSAPHRDVSKLAGHKHAKGAGRVKAHHDEVEDISIAPKASDAPTKDSSFSLATTVGPAVAHFTRMRATK